MDQAANIPVLTIIPFLMMLGSIAVLPLVANKFWENNRNKLFIAIILSLPIAIWLLFNNFGYELFFTLVYDYIPFIVLLTSLFIITGNIHIYGDIEAKPHINVAFMAIGAVCASIMGTTGAAMLLIRPLLQTNRERKYKIHTILFFIAIVANCGGLLTPLGDPPLFMMYLRGAGFFWFLKLAPEWFFVNGILLLIYFIYDKYYWKKESFISHLLDKIEIRPISIKGKLNFIWLLGVVGAVAIINQGNFPSLRPGTFQTYWREGIIALMAVLSMLFTSKQIREYNFFEWGPIQEVIYIFLGIFITMVPCLIYLEVNARALGISTPGLFYYSAGTLSSFLDNTPTAVTFYSLARGLVEKTPALLTGNVVGGIPENLMKAISVASVFFGSMTYIGNGPNFMVKAIAESQGVKMPHFFQYIYKFSLIILLPLFILVELLLIR